MNLLATTIHLSCEFPSQHDVSPETRSVTGRRQGWKGQSWIDGLAIMNQKIARTGSDLSADKVGLLAAPVAACIGVAWGTEELIRRFRRRVS
jgi:hypothetical protein